MIGIFGANGFIGHHLVKRLDREGIPSRAFSRRFDLDLIQNSGPRIEFVEGDFTHSLERASALDGLDVVVQLISTSSPGLKNDHAITDIQENVIPHVSFLQECVRAKIKRFVFLSSGGTVYGPSVQLPTSEDFPTNPISSHGITKLTVENYIRMFGYVEGLEYSILRVANPFGPGQVFKKGQGLIPAVLDRIKRQAPVHIFGNGNARRDFIYIDDLVEAIYRSMITRKLGGSVLNIGSGETRSINEVLGTIEGALGLVVLREYLPVRSTDVSTTFLDIRRAKEILDWSPVVAFEDGIGRTVATFK